MMTRKTFEWHPSKLLCKRFNIPEPYPSSSKTGLVCEGEKKFSLGQLFEISEKDKGSEETYLNKTKDTSDNSNPEFGGKVISKNLYTHENVRNSSSPSSIVALDQQKSEKPSMDLFKAIFVSSSEDESGNSEDENLEDEDISYTLPGENTVSKLQKTSHQGKFDILYKDEGIYKPSVQADVKTSDSEIVKPAAEQNVIETKDEYGPRAPPLRSLREDSDVKLEFQSRQTVPFSRHDSNSESENDKPKRKHKKKQKHKSKQRHKDKEKVKDKLRKTERGKAIKNNHEISSDSPQQHCTSHEQNNRSKQQEIPDDKQILSRLKAVQKRRMCAADFM